jgi:hypothetical protein
MAFQQSDLDTIDAAIAGGVQRVKFADGREVWYPGIADLIKAKQTIEGALATAGGRSRRCTPAYRNGF